MAQVADDARNQQDGRVPVLISLCLCAVIAYVQRGAISVPAQEISEDLRFANLAQDMGWIQSGWYIGYGLLQLPSGWVADRIGSRVALAIFMSLWSAATLVSGFASGFYSLLILWTIMGAAQAGAFPCAAKAIGQIFPESQRARATGLLASGMAIGGALTPYLTSTLLGSFDSWAQSSEIERWRLLFAAYALPGFLWTAIFLAAIPASMFPAGPQLVPLKSKVDWTAMLRSWPLALLCAQQFFRAAGMVFFLTWFPTFLQKSRGVTLDQSGLLTTIAGAGGVIGSMSGGFFSDWLFKRTGSARLSRQGIAVAGMAACSALMVASYFVKDVNGSIALIAVGVFCATFGGISGYTVAISFGGRHVATVFSTMNMCGNFGAALFPATAGWLVTQTGNWNVILFFFAGIMAVDAVCWALLNPKGTLFDEGGQKS